MYASLHLPTTQVRHDVVQLKYIYLVHPSLYLYTTQVRHDVVQLKDDVAFERSAEQIDGLLEDEVEWFS